jgi:hypothetical protein
VAELARDPKTKRFCLLILSLAPARRSYKAALGRVPIQEPINRVHLDL